MPNTILVKKCYVMMTLYDNNGHTNWATFVRTHLYENGFEYVWNFRIFKTPTCYHIIMFKE